MNQPATNKKQLQQAILYPNIAGSGAPSRNKYTHTHAPPCNWTRSGCTKTYHSATCSATTTSPTIPQLSQKRSAALLEHVCVRVRTEHKYRPDNVQPATCYAIIQQKCRTTTTATVVTQLQTRAHESKSSVAVSPLVLGLGTRIQQ